ncbi:alpha/beta fold hydrolase [Enterocloster lavalensis]|uniref:alpha/beta fold hydrolase n=1 Tax=Enterocloster lavalensis TaxID=460384 RepID=UPI0023F441A7|nr:alpha/beta hydrolase [Enterocloster lavalensis]
MKTRNKLLTLLILSAGAATATALINKAVKISATSKNVLSDPESLCYKWRLGNIHYTKAGTGKPLLLVHDLTPSSSGYEWTAIAGRLAETYTVYTIDLLGCGRSEKPNLTYTNYLYVQLISDFIKSEIGHRTDVIATGASAALAVMACGNSPELFDRLMFINPDSLLACSQVSGRHAKLYKFMLDLPIAGTLLYHIATSRKSLTEELKATCFYNPYMVRTSMLDAYHEAAHLGESPKSVYSSVRCHYTKCNIVNALKKIDNSIYLLGGDGEESIQERFDEYKEINPIIEYSLIANTKHLPQLEKPGEVLKAIQTYFS